jgi:addiction module RelE/StbE family toxin
MTFPIIWTAPARAQLAELHEYIAESSLSTADHQVAAIADSTHRLSIFPEIGRPGRRSGTRALVIAATSYIVVYRVRESTIRILAVMHGAQRWPRSFGF